MMMNRLFRKYWYLTVVALLCCAPMAFGQTSMTLQSSVYSNPSLAGVYTGAYPFSITANGNTTLTGAVCDDYSDEIYVNESWQVTVSTFSQLNSAPNTLATPDYTGVMWGGNSSYTQAQLYDQAAWLVEQMPPPGTSPLTTSNISFAIWDIFDPAAFTNLGANGPAGDTGCTSTQAGLAVPPTAGCWLLAAENQQYTTGGFSNFEILTPIMPSGGWGPDGRPQEFLVQTPESSTAVMLGADMLGLLGLVFVFRRRLVWPIL